MPLASASGAIAVPSLGPANVFAAKLAGVVL